MILFRPEHVEPILSGRKVQTRRLGKRRWNVGAIHACYTRPPFARGGAEPFCRVRITGVRLESLWDLTMDGVHAEGYDTFEEFQDVWDAINGDGSFDSDPDVWVVEFEVVTP